MGLNYINQDQLTYVDRNTKIIIIGAGIFGLSTALSLARQGYRKITVLDRSTHVPSNASKAGQMPQQLFHTLEYVGELDLNTRIRYEAKQVWQFDPILKSSYHPTGFLYASCDLEYLNDRMAGYLNNNPDAVLLDTPEKIKKHVPVLTGSLDHWFAYYLRKDEGWVDSHEALTNAYQECINLGVKFILGPQGDVTELICENGKMKGVLTNSGESFTAARYALCVSGNEMAKLFTFTPESEERCFAAAQVQLTQDEVKKLRDCPVIFNNDKGFFFEPKDNKDQMLVSTEIVAANMLNKEKDKDMLFMKTERQVRRYLQETLPELKDRPLNDLKLCWLTKYADADLVLAEHPDIQDLVVCPGDWAADSFMMMPVIGTYISRVIVNGNEGLSDVERDRWRFRTK